MADSATSKESVREVVCDAWLAAIKLKTGENLISWRREDVGADEHP